MGMGLVQEKLLLKRYTYMHSEKSSMVVIIVVFRLVCA